MSESTVKDLAIACVAAVKDTVGVELDFTQDTLPILDHYARTAELANDELLSLFAPMCGAYFGEVVARSMGSSRWVSPVDAPERWRLEFADCFLHFNPVGMAVEALTQRTAEGWGAQLQMLKEDEKAVKAAVDVYGDVRDDDYFRFSVRFEVVEQVHATLSRRASEKGETHLNFGPDVYVVAVDQLRASEDEPAS